MTFKKCVLVEFRFVEQVRTSLIPTTILYLVYVFSFGLDSCETKEQFADFFFFSWNVNLDKYITRIAKCILLTLLNSSQMKHLWYYQIILVSFCRKLWIWWALHYNDHVNQIMEAKKIGLSFIWCLLNLPEIAQPKVFFTKL